MSGDFGEVSAVSALAETVERSDGELLLVEESVIGGEGGDFSRAESILNSEFYHMDHLKGQNASNKSEAVELSRLSQHHLVSPPSLPRRTCRTRQSLYRLDILRS